MIGVSTVEAGCAGAGARPTASSYSGRTGREADGDNGVIGGEVLGREDALERGREREKKKGREGGREEREGGMGGREGGRLGWG